MKAEDHRGRARRDRWLLQESKLRIILTSVRVWESRGVVQVTSPARLAASRQLADASRALLNPALQDG